MTRPKVPAELRQRTAQACESCKRRKQKCNGLSPCNTCTKRKLTCIYSERDQEGSPASEERPTKKRATDERAHETQTTFDQSKLETPSKQHHRSSSTAQPRTPGPPNFGSTQTDTLRQSNWADITQNATTGPGRDSNPAAKPTGQKPSESVSHSTTAPSGQDEEAVVYSQSRMLQDPTGRLLYVGDSATLSFLQLLRMMVENAVGPTPFTNDPNRHKIIESQTSLPSGTRNTNVLPDQTTARILVDAYFVNTHGLLFVFDQDKFLEDLDQCYLDPLSAEPSFLCLLNLIFAIGLTMANPMSGSAEAVVIDKLRSEHVDRAQMFYLNAKSQNDPIIGLEDQDFWAVQGLLLRAMYMLVRSKRNWAFALVGTAARSAQALGLHREETMVIFNQQEQRARRNLWRSIFVLDRFLSCSLGRPTAISEDDCSGDTLCPAAPTPENMLDPHATLNDSGEKSLESTVRSCSTIGLILKKVYQQRKITTRLAQDIADICKGWPCALPPSLHWRQAASATPSLGIAILHVNLFYCHSIVLLTRPFFVYILNIETQRQMNQVTTGSLPPRPYQKMEKFSEACVIASTHTILLVQNAFDAGYLSRRNPVVIYFLFSAALVILANEFAGLYAVDASDTCIFNAITLMGYCAESSQWASRLVYIMSSFRDVVAMQKMQREQSQTELHLPSISSQIHTGPTPNQQQNAGTLGLDPNNKPPTPRLHQVPIHIYPGMQTAPPPAGPSKPNENEAQDHSAPPESLLPPIQNPREIAALSEPYTMLPISKSTSLSNFLDLPALESTRVPSLHSEESFGPDEQIDFDALWAWPSNTHAVGSPRATGDEALNTMVQGSVPLYDFMEN